MLIEVIVTSVEDAIEAERGGAGRLELVRRLDQEGLTPPLVLARLVLRAVSIPVRVMVREANAFELEDAAELERLCASARAFADLPVDGLVLGFVRDGDVDAHAVARVLAAAPRVRATFHRAIEHVRDMAAAVRALARWPQFDRVLACGGAGPWRERLAGLEALSRALPPGVTLLPGGGIGAAEIAALSRSSFSEAHVGRAAREPASAAGRVSADRVRVLVDAARQPEAPRP